MSTASAALLCLMLTLSIPLVAVLTWSAASARVIPAQEVHTVTATAIKSGHSAAELSSTTVRIPQSTTMRWQWHGEQHTGELPVTSAPAAGETTQLRVDGNGTLLSQRYGNDDAVAMTVVATVTAAAVAAVLAFAALRLRSRWLFRRRELDWEREWMLVQPLWTDRGYRA